MATDVYIVDRTRTASWWRRISPVHWVCLVGGDLRELSRDRHVIGYQVVADLKTRYQHSFLGVLWSLLNPMLMLGVLAVVFSQILNRRTTDMVFYLFSGLVPWFFFNQALTSGSQCLLKRANLLSKLRINKLVFPIAVLGDGLITLVLTLLGLMLVLVPLFGMPLTVHAIATPLCVLVLAGFTFGLALLAMVLVVYFRDLEHIIGVVLRGWYFFTPILYPINRIKDPRVLYALNLNPMTHLVGLFRSCLYDNQWPSLDQWLTSSAIALGALAAGYTAYKLREDDLLFRL